MNTEFMEFRDTLATISESDPELDYTPVNVDEGFVSLDIFACHYIHYQNDHHPTIRFYLLQGEDTISSRCDDPSYIYHWNGELWVSNAAPEYPPLSSADLAKASVVHLHEMAEQLA